MHSLLFLSVLLSAEPTLRTVDLRGLQIGGKTTLVADGSDFGSTPRLLLPWPNAKAELQPGGTAAKATFVIDLPADVVPGLYQIRLATDDGASAPVVIGVDPLPQVPLSKQPVALPVAVHGDAPGSTPTEVRFAGQAGQEITIEIESQRLGGKLRPVLHLLDESRKQVAWSWPMRPLFGDTRLTAKLPANGMYTVQIHDSEYAQGGLFRLKLGSWQYADVAFPAAISRGKRSPIELLGKSAMGRIDMEPTGPEDFVAAPWPTGVAASGPRVPVLVSDLPEFVEQPAGATASPQEIAALPAAVNGRLTVAGETDQFKLPVTPGVKIRFELFAERIASPLDTVLVLQDEKGQQLARGDDSPGSTDTVLEFTPGPNVTSVIAVVSDLQGQGGLAAVYRLVAEPQTPAATRGDFRAFTPNSRLRLASSNRLVVPVLIDRKGFDGALRVSSDSLPAGVTLSNTDIPADCDGGLVLLTGAAAPISQLVSLRVADLENKLLRTVNLDEHPLATFQPWLRRELVCSVTPESKFQIDWGTLPTDAMLPIADKLVVPLKIVRPEGDPTPVRVSLVTSQFGPRANNKLDPAKALKIEKVLDLAADKAEGEVAVTVPLELAAPSYELALTAELLSKDGKTVVATTASAPRRFPVVYPAALQFAATKVSTTLDPKSGATAVFAGKLVRRPGVDGDVTLAATGQPAGTKADNVIVKAGTTDFEFKVVFPPSQAPGDVTGIRLAATASIEVNKQKQNVKLKDVVLSVAVLASKPDA